MINVLFLRPDGLRDTKVGNKAAHPKVYVSFFKHASFFNKKTSVEVYDAASQGDEYRSDDWYYMATKGDKTLVKATELGTSAIAMTPLIPHPRTDPLKDAYKDKYGSTSAPYWTYHKKEDDSETICDWKLS